MSMSFGAILIARDFTDEDQAVLRILDIDPADVIGDIRIDDAVRRSFEHTAVGAYAGVTIVIDPVLPYGCSFKEDELYGMDERLMELSRDAQVLCFFLEGISGTYGFAKFEAGKKVRWRAVEPGKVLIDQGSGLPAEHGFAPKDDNDEERIFAITREFLSVQFDELIADGDLMLREYASKREG